MKQRALPLGDPIATLASYLGYGGLVLEDAALAFLVSGRVTYAQTDVPPAVLTEAAAHIWTVDEIAELRALQEARKDATPALDDDGVCRREWLDACRAENACYARLIRRVSPRRAAYFEQGL